VLAVRGMSFADSGGRSAALRTEMHGSWITIYFVLGLGVGVNGAAKSVVDSILIWMVCFTETVMISVGSEILVSYNTQF
jgi:hypothetical protein